MVTRITDSIFLLPSPYLLLFTNWPYCALCFDLFKRNAKIKLKYHHNATKCEEVAVINKILFQKTPMPRNSSRSVGGRKYMQTKLCVSWRSGCWLDWRSHRRQCESIHIKQTDFNEVENSCVIYVSKLKFRSISLQGHFNDGHYPTTKRTSKTKRSWV